MALTQASANRKDVGKIADMQHRHFATIATILRSYNGTLETRRTMVEHFATELARTNSKFDRARFIAAATVGLETGAQ